MWSPAWRRQRTARGRRCRSLRFTSRSAGAMRNASSTATTRRFSRPIPAILRPSPQTSGFGTTRRRRGFRGLPVRWRPLGWRAPGPPVGRKARRLKRVLQDTAAFAGRVETLPGGRASRPSNRGHGSQARCTRGSSPKASPERRSRQRVARPGSTGGTRSRESSAKKLGDCQCVRPGTMSRSTSDSIVSNASPFGRGGRKGGAKLAGTARESTGMIRRALIVGDPIDDGVAVSSEIFRGHVIATRAVHRSAGEPNHSVGEAREKS